MNDTSARLRNIVVWGVPFAIVLAALGYETDWGRDVAKDAAAPAGAPQPVAVALLPEYRIEGGVEARKETVDRVLFNPTRRPAPPSTQTAASPGQVKHGLYTLTGTTMAGNVTTAMLREVTGGKSHVVRQGETLNGVVVAEVKPDFVRLRQGTDVEDLHLKIAAGPKTTVQLAAPTPAVPGQPVPQAGAAAPAHAVAPPAAPPAAGGSGTPVPAVRPARPAAPAAGANPGIVSVGELLARRRAAAAAAAAAAGGQATPAPGAQPR